jgi:hypothetical protein
VGGIDTASPTQISAVNGQINQIQAQILNVVNHDATLATMAVGADGTVGFVALPPGTTPNHRDVVASTVAFPPETTPSHSDAAASSGHHFEHMWG